MNRKREGGIVEVAIEFAGRAHEGQFRKMTDIPYVTHPFAVAMKLARMGEGEAVIAAAILHDTVEDTEATFEELRARFGDDVAAIVEGCTESDRSLPWEARKEAILARIPEASREVRVVVAADKLHNLRSIRTDHEQVGARVWERFSRGPEKQRWYYAGMIQALRSGKEDPGINSLVLELESEYEILFGRDSLP